MPERRSPRVFIRYSHDIVEHQARVLDLDDRLSADDAGTVSDKFMADYLRK